MAISPNPASPLSNSFDPTSAVVFELGEGRVRRAEGQPVVLLPAAVLAELCSSLNEAQLAKLGAAMGTAAGSSFGAAGSGWTLPQIVEQLGGEISLAGLGSFSIERWGSALVVQVQGCPLQASGPAVMAAYVRGALHALVGTEVTAVPVETSQFAFRILLCGAAAASRVTQWLAAGKSFGDALASLQSSQGAN